MLQADCNDDLMTYKGKFFKRRRLRFYKSKLKQFFQKNDH